MSRDLVEIHVTGDRQRHCPLEQKKVVYSTGPGGTFVVDRRPAEPFRHGRRIENSMNFSSEK